MEIDQTKLNVFYDDVCGVCDKFISLILSLVNSDLLRLYSLQEALLNRALADQYQLFDLSSIVVITNNEKLIKARAIFQILKQTKLRKLILLLEYIPIKYCDLCYEFVAKHRYKICKPIKKKRS